MRELRSQDARKTCARDYDISNARSAFALRELRSQYARKTCARDYDTMFGGKDEIFKNECSNYFDDFV